MHRALISSDINHDDRYKSQPHNYHKNSRINVHNRNYKKTYKITLSSSIIFGTICKRQTHRIDWGPFWRSSPAPAAFPGDAPCIRKVQLLTESCTNSWPYTLPCQPCSDDLQTPNTFAPKDQEDKTRSGNKNQRTYDKRSEKLCWMIFKVITYRKSNENKMASSQETSKCMLKSHLPTAPLLVLRQILNSHLNNSLIRRGEVRN